MCVGGGGVDTVCVVYGNENDKEVCLLTHHEIMAK